ncbi:PREDICTED: uncharacterized protein LOC108970451 [Bactrocera latifrons]|uniref:Uncharacterized protein n=2 Tax=Bactrocera latifrons TaxID=174628 RepID=A0A0K8WID3_BACLA|nr:PREDICTED: uncharacterized protein LOC108970451 [Bactrocera latifrons]
MESSITALAESNWKRVGGCELSQTLQTRTTHEDIFIRPSLDEIIRDENAVLLKKGESNDACELLVCLKRPFYKIDSLSLVCTTPKLELFLGPLKEYAETLYGETADDEDDNDDGEVFSYRYDIEVQKSGITEVLLKLLTPTDDICIFGILIQMAPNPNGITTGTEINMENVQKMLNTGQKISPNAEKCMLFMQTAKQMQSMGNVQSNSTLLEHMKQALANRETHSSELEAALKTHIDNRFEQLERKITTHLNTLLSEQNEKLDKILQIMENGKLN